MAVTGDGATLYVAAFGSSKIGVFATAELASDTFVPSGAHQIAVSGGGPTGVVLDEPRRRLYVLTRFDDAISVVDTLTMREIGHVPLFNPEPPSVVAGRRFLYDAARTSGHGDSACRELPRASATPIIWPGTSATRTEWFSPTRIRFAFRGTVRDPAFHPMKGPMVTQSLRGLAGAGPMHWRGDRTGGSDPGGDALDEEAAFKKFDVAFDGLLGRPGALSPDRDAGAHRLRAAIDLPARTRCVTSTTRSRAESGARQELLQRRLVGSGGQLRDVPSPQSGPGAILARTASRATTPSLRPSRSRT